MDNQLSQVIEKVEENLKDSLLGMDRRYQDNLVKLFGKSPEEALRFTSWDWTHGIGLFGLYKMYQATGDVTRLDMAEAWFQDRIRIGLPQKNVNTVAPLLTMAYLYELRPNAAYKEIMDEWAFWIMTEMPRTEEGGLLHSHAELDNKQDIWDDTLVMTILFLAKYGKMFQKEECIEEATYQFLLHAKYLHEPISGLWYHGWTFQKRNNFAGALWARGNCWITIFLVEYLDLVTLPEALKRYALGLLKNHADALVRCQDVSGLWHTLLDVEDSYLEASGSAGFCCGLLAAIRKGYLDESYLPCAKKALQAIIDHVTPDGELSQVSFGTNVGDTLEHYKNIELRKTHYGQALAMMALIEGIYLE